MCRNILPSFTLKLFPASVCRRRVRSSAEDRSPWQKGIASPLAPWQHSWLGMQLCPGSWGGGQRSLGNQTVQNQSTLRDRRRHRHKGSESCIPAAEGCCRQRCPACMAGLQQHLSLPTWPPPSSSAGLRSFPWLWAALQPRRTPGSPPAALPRQHRPGSSAQRGRAAPALYVHLVRLCKL